MKKILFLALMAGIALPVSAQKNKKTDKTVKPAAPAVKPVPQDEEESERRRFQEENRVLTPFHHRLLQMAGPWREETKVWSHPGAEPTVSLAVREGRPMMDGRYVQMSVMGDSKMGHFEAQSLIGWDNLKKIYVKTWYDNIGTGILVLEGTLDEEKNIIEFRGMTIDPKTRMPVPVRQVLNMSNPQLHILEVYTEFKGKEYKAMEIRSSRS